MYIKKQNMKIPNVIGGYCWNNIYDKNGKECRVLITKCQENTYYLQCDDNDIDEEFSSIEDLKLFCNEKFCSSALGICFENM